MKKNHKEIPTNLEILCKSKERPRTGDVFVVKPRGDDCYFGLVVNSDIKLVNVFGEPSNPNNWDVVLGYIYNQQSANKQEIPKLDLTKLLLPPLLLDVWCWKLGYVERVGNITLTPDHVLPRHCFLQVSLLPEQGESYRDEHGRPLARQTEPCSTYGLTPFRGLDDMVSRALGIPEVKE